MSEPLEPGSKIGHYEILSTLGAGGMGRVSSRTTRGSRGTLRSSSCAPTYLRPRTGAGNTHVTPDGKSYVYSYALKRHALYLVGGLK